MQNRFYDTGPGPKKGEKGYCNIWLVAPAVAAILLVAILMLFLLPVNAQAQPPWTPNPTEYLVPEPCGNCLFLPVVIAPSQVIDEPVLPVTPTAPPIEITVVPSATPTPTPTATPEPPGTPFPVTPDPSILTIERFFWFTQSPDSVVANMTVCNYSGEDRIIAPHSDITHLDDFILTQQAWHEQTYLVPANRCIYPTTTLPVLPEHGVAVEVNVYF